MAACGSHAEKEENKTRAGKELHTSRSKLDRLLDPKNAAVSLNTINRAARALGKRLIIRIADAKAADVIDRRLRLIV